MVRLAHYAWTVQTIWFILNTCFSLGSLAFWYVPGKRYLCDQLPENLGCRVSNGLPWAETRPTCCYIFIIGGRMDSESLIRGREHRKLTGRFCRPCQCLWPLGSSAYSYHIPVTNLSHEHNCMLASPMKLSRKTPDGGWSWRPSTEVDYVIMASPTHSYIPMFL